VHRSTLVNALRFTTPELSEFEEKIVSAESNLFQKEYEIFRQVSQTVLEKFQQIKEVSTQIAHIDVMANFAQVAYENHYVEPEMHEGYDMEIVGGRHPVIEKIEKNFIQNELFLSKDTFVHIITGPNM
jgi:DNA mismatch repair protein MutS